MVGDGPEEEERLVDEDGDLQEERSIQLMMI